jgi:hypothetical protein
MNRLVAEPLFQQELQSVASLGYAALSKLADSEPLTKELPGPDGQTYQTEIQVFWDSGKNGPIRVLGAIDDCGRSAFRPLCLDDIIDPTPTGGNS